MPEVLDPREQAAQEMEREKAIAEYLRESLSGEERVVTPMDSRCEVSVVIPAYAEREGIFRPLLSLARQEGVRPEQFEVLIVVNNPPTEPMRQADESEVDWRRKRDLYLMSAYQNQQTLDLLRALSGEKIPADATDEERAYVEEIRASGIRVFGVDKASDGKTLLSGEANVGGARNRGVAEAVERFQKIGRNGIVAQSDADVRFSANYVASLVSVFARDAELVGIAGKIHFDKSEEMEEIFAAASSTVELFSRYHWVADMLKAGREAHAEAGKPRVMFSGANMASRAFEAAEAGGVPKIPGGEDPAFGLRLAGIGPVRQASEVVTHPLDRFSARTAVSAGHGQKRLQLRDLLEGGQALVESPAAIFAFRRIARELYRRVSDPSTTAKDLQALMTVEGTRLLDDKDIDLVVRTIRSGNDAVHTTPPLRMLRHEINRRLDMLYPKVPVDQAVERILVDVTQDEIIRERYEEKLREMRDDEVSRIRGRERMISSLADLLRADPSETTDRDTIVRVISEHKDAFGPEADAIIERLTSQEFSDRLDRLVRSLESRPAAEEALRRMRSEFPDAFVLPEEDAANWTLMKLSALSRAFD